MRLHYGKIPEDESFLPKQAGWTPLREPTPWIAQLISLPIAILSIMFLLILRRLLYPDSGTAIHLGMYEIIIVIFVDCFMINLTEDYETI